MKDIYGIDSLVITNGKGEINSELDKLGIKNYVYNFYGWIDIKNTPKIKHLLKYLRYKVMNPIEIYKMIKKFKNDSISLIHTNSSYTEIGSILAKN